MKTMTPRQLRIALATAIAMFLLLVLVLNLRWLGGITGAIFSESEPPGIYREVDVPVRRGGMVQLRQLMKHVAGVPGDTVLVTPEGSYVNGKLWPYSAIPAGSTYSHYPFGLYKLAPGQFWLLGRHPLSWDSRYAGPIPQDLISGAIQPVWTISNGYAPGTLPWHTEQPR
jgi:type IV secretory pathway protease TraF